MPKTDEPRSLRGAPPAMLERVGTGLLALADYHAESTEQFIGTVSNALDQGVTFPFSASSQLPDVDNIDLPRDSWLALSFLVSAIVLDVASEEDLNDLFDRLLEREILSSNDLPRVRPIFLAALEQQPRLAQGFEKTHLGNRLVPSLRDVEYETEIRVELDEGNIVEHVPLALVHVETDIDGQDLYFQLTRYQLRFMRAVLDAAEQELIDAEKWASDKDTE